MPRIDKTESAIGVTRGTLDADLPTSDYDKVIGVGFNASGRVVKGAGTTGIIGVINPSKTARRAGDIVDIFGNGSEFLDFEGSAGTVYYAATATGAVSTTNTGTKIGFTTESDRLVVTI